ncbi:MAG: hypothetical protein ISR43_07055 [Acidimicrobiia bacterium]|nr:hypothetical protein [Actinomycetota bacterium]MBL6925014.1 hypothetical protein [Acidimicrobiia bacterium]MBL6926969.1 hypothetical protein [Acidimicrobiia bacterium]
MGSVPDQTVTREDLEAELRRTVGDVGDKASANRRTAVVVGLVVGGLVVLAAYLAGRRIGKTRSTVVEIRRI